METAPIRVLVVDDYEPWRRFFSSALQKELGLQVIGEASDGLAAVKKAQDLQPDLILLDIGLPTLHGIEAARQIRELSPASRILFVSENRSVDIVKEALTTGACGYVVKSDAARELMPAIRIILRNKRFVSARLMNEEVSDSLRVVTPLSPDVIATGGRHQCEFYPDDASLIEGFTDYINSALESGAAVTFVATDSHVAGVFERLKAYGLDLDLLAKQGRYATVDVTETLPTLVRDDGRLDLARCSKVLGELVPTAPDGAPYNRVVACGEFAPVLLKGGNVEAAIEMEHLTNEFTRTHNVDVFCGYLHSSMPQNEGSSLIRRIRQEHSVISDQPWN